MASRARNRRRFKSSTSRLTMQSYAIKGCVLRTPLPSTTRAIHSPLQDPGLQSALDPLLKSNANESI